MKVVIKPEHLAFLESAREFRDKKRAENLPANTFRDEENGYIALFINDCDDIQVFELGPEVAYFAYVTKNEKEIK